MDAFDNARLGEAEQVVQALEVPARVLEPFAAISRLVELVLLHHRAHRAVENDDAFAQQTLQLFGPVLYWLHFVKCSQNFRSISTSAVGACKYHSILI